MFIFYKKKKSFALTVMTLLVALLTTNSVPAQGSETVDITGYTATAGTEGISDSEVYGKLVDNSTDTKWCVVQANNTFTGAYIEFNTNYLFVPKGYVMTTANDTYNNTGRNPKSWEIKARKNTTDEWTTIATVTDDNTMPTGTAEAPYADGEFTIDNTADYQYFRLEVTAIQSDGTFQLSEFKFRGIIPESSTYNLEDATISGFDDKYFITGHEIKPLPTVTSLDGKMLKKDTDYTVEWSGDGTTAGTYTVTVTGIGSYSGSKSATYIVFADVNMPATGNKKIELTGYEGSIKVYDDGGKDGYYSNNCNGYLVLTAPEDYVLQLSGTIKTANSGDDLTVYDGSTDSAEKLLDIVASEAGFYGTVKTNITTVASTGNSMMLYFRSSGSGNSDGLDLTVTIINTNTKYGITTNEASGGTLVSDLSEAKFRETVTLTATPSNGYVLSDISVKDAANNDVAIDWSLWNNNATFKMPGSAATVTPTFANNLESLSVNMPTTGTKSATIPSSVQSVKVYDDGGKDGDYSNDSDGTLVLTAPEGYVLQLSGTVITEKYNDHLTVYDGSTNNAEKLLNKVTSDNESTKTIYSIVSTGQSMTLFFHSDHNLRDSGLDLTVTPISTNTDFSITTNTAEGGTFASNNSTAKVNEIVTLTATPSSGYVLSGISVKDADNNDVAIDWNVWTNSATFKMPGSAVTVTPTFTNELGSLSVNMPTTGTKTATIPSGVSSFKVYDDGGNSSNYSYDCDGRLVLMAPTGYVLQLSGTITIGNNDDYLTVYDGNTNSTTKLLDAVTNSSSEAKSITKVTTTGQSMTLYFYSDDDTNSPGLDLTVTLISTTADFNITTNTAEGGTFASDKSTAKVNETIILTATPSSGYVLSDISVKDADNNDVAIDWNVWTNSATFKMPGSAVTVTPTFTNDLGNLSVNMLTTGTKAVTIPSGVLSFKVYDDGGKDDHYSDECKGTLVLTAPTGYVIELSGDITIEESCDKLTVYDGSTNSATKLLDEVSSEDDKTVPITTVTSTGNSMTLYFCSDYSDNYDGLDLTVKAYNPDEDYNINIVSNTTGGSVTSNTAQAKYSEDVTLTAMPSSGYVLSSITVTDANNNDVALNWSIWNNSATFKMPGSAVTVTPTFTNELESLSINMPTTGTKTATIPSSVQSFKVYDDGGKDDDYSNECNGTLVLTAPEGYVLQLSGNITTEDGCDNLTVYDGSTNSATKLLNNVCGNNDEEAVPITTVVSTGNSMTLYFYSDDDTNYPGLDLTVTLIKKMELADNADNSTAINEADGRLAIVTLTGRTLYKDGYWNTLCLPFAVSNFTDTPLDGADVRALVSSSVSDKTLTMNFSESSLTAIEAGKPYLVKWADPDNNIDDITSPVFNNVTISKTTTNAVTTYVDFIGSFSPVAFNANDKSVLFLGGSNTLYYPDADKTIGSCRAYFKLKNVTAGTPATDARGFVMNFGEETNGLTPAPSRKGEGSSYFYNLKGQRVNKPASKGMYISNGKKIIIK